MGIHESQSLFFENFIGRHFGFWKRHYDFLRKYTGENLQDVPLEDFYRAINESKPSLIRVEADRYGTGGETVLYYRGEQSRYDPITKRKERRRSV